MIECLLRVATYTRKITFVFGAIVFCLLQGKTQSAGKLHHLHHEQQAEEQKCLCDMAALHRFLHQLRLSFIWCQQQKIWSFQKNWHQCSPPSLARSPSSSMFLQPASCASLPPYPPPITNMTSTQRQPTPPSLPLDRPSPSSFICHCRSSLLSLLDNTEGVQSDFVNHFFCSN